MERCNKRKACVYELFQMLIALVIIFIYTDKNIIYSNTIFKSQSMYINIATLFIFAI
jgi:hypothetical protein